MARKEHERSMLRERDNRSAEVLLGIHMTSKYQQQQSDMFPNSFHSVTSNDIDHSSKRFSLRPWTPPLSSVASLFQIIFWGLLRVLKHVGIRSGKSIRDFPWPLLSVIACGVGYSTWLGQAADSLYKKRCGISPTTPLKLNPEASLVNSHSSSPMSSSSSMSVHLGLTTARISCRQNFSDTDIPRKTSVTW